MSRFLGILGMGVLCFLAMFGMVVWFPFMNYTMFVVGSFPITIPFVAWIGSWGTLVKVTA